MRSTLLFVVAIAAKARYAAPPPQRDASGAYPVPRWAPSWRVNDSTIVMPCNDSGYFDTQLTKNFAVVSFDWSNAKALWANGQPMDCEERLIDQVRLTKAANPATKVWVYRNLVKALPWYTTVWTKLAAPAFDGWFLKFSGANNYHVPPCDDNYDPPLCSAHYHDIGQTPGHPRGDGDCVEKCNCGGVPCGEYLWDHRNTSLRTYILNEVVLGLNGLQNENVSGFFFDDGWSDSPAPILPWEPKQGFCDHSPIGGATEEDFFCTADMGLVQADTTAITAAFRETFSLVQQAVIGAGAFAWQYMRTTTAPVGANESTCAAWVRDWRDAATSAYVLTQNTPAHQKPRPEKTNPNPNPTPPKPYQNRYMQEWSNPQTRPLPSVESDLAAFLLVRGPYAWIGYSACATAPALGG
jgi:hypothetical protein